LQTSESKSGLAVTENSEKGQISQQPQAPASDEGPQCAGSRLKRPAAKFKSRRRNILNFPHHLSVDELRLLQVIKKPLIDDKNAGGAIIGCQISVFAA
jgi:hypothetical protein